MLVGLGLGLALGSVVLLYLTAAVLAVAIVALRRRVTLEDRPAERLRLREGLSALWRHPVLRNLTILTSVSNLVWATFEALFVVSAIAPGYLGLTLAQYGLVLALGALGGIVASFATPWLLRRMTPTPIMAVDMVGTVLLVLPLALGAPLWIVAGSILLASAGSTAWRIIAASYRQQEVAEGLLGRVYSAYRVISWGSLPVGAGIAAGVAALAGITAAYWAGTAIAAVMLALFVVLLVRRPVRLVG